MLVIYEAQLHFLSRESVRLDELSNYLTSYLPLLELPQHDISDVI